MPTSLSPLIRIFHLVATAVLPCMSLHAAPIAETLHAFAQGPMNPSGGLLIGPDGGFYGTTEKGGPLGGGVFYKTTAAGEFTVLHQFTTAGGTYPTGGLLLANDGNFYGSTRSNGTNGKGTIYRMTPQGGFTVLRQLDSASGSVLTGPLVQDSTGLLHGNFASGGNNGQGVVFSIKTDGTSFSGAALSNSTGYSPKGSPVPRPDGIYGVASSGGSSGLGAVFKRSYSGGVQIFKGMDAAIRHPSALVFAGDGNFYGMGYYPGYLSTDTDNGIIFKLTPAGVISKLTTITDVGDSHNSVSLEVRADGDLYGYAHGMSTYYKITLTGSRTIVGTTPPGLDGRLSHAPDGSIYGAAKSGNTGGNGCIFKLVPESAPEELVTFGNDQGTSPSGLMELPGGTFLGTTSVAGTEGSTSFRLTAEAKFSAVPFLPSHPLTIGPDQSPYGIGNGSFYRVDLAKGILPLQVPLISGLGFSPGLCLSSDGNFYGTSYKSIFKITPPGVQTLLATVNDQGFSWRPDDPLTEGADGMLYGVTYWGGTSATPTYAGVGTVFRATKEGQVTILKHFEDKTGVPKLPKGKLVRHPDGNLYGTTYGGTLGNGTIFKIAPNGIYTQVAEFPSAFNFSGRELTLGADNALYGLAEASGSNPGVVFRVTTAGVFSAVATLTPLNVSGLRASLVKGSDGNLYGVASSGGILPDGTTAGGGAVFRIRYGPASRTISVTQVGNETATFHGTVDPGGLPTTVSFQCATKPDFSDMRTFPAGTAAVAGGIKSFTLEATGLARSTKYHVRMAASNSDNPITQMGDPIQFTTFPLPAEIVVENAAGQALEENAITEIGGTTGQRPATQTFTVRNNGQTDLTGTQITITGGAPEFAVVSQPAGVIPGGGTSTFTISLLPSSDGAKAGTFLVESSDRYRNPIPFGVKGTGFTLSSVDFPSATTVPASVAELVATGLQLGPVSLGFPPATDTVVKLIDNTGTAPVQGHFDALPEGALLEVSEGTTKYPFKISYSGGDGNDVVLIRALPPTAYFNAASLVGSVGHCYFDVTSNSRPVTSATFQYGLDESRGATAEVRKTGGQYPNEYAVTLENISKGTRYYYRFTLTTTDGTATVQGTFTTSPTITNINFPTHDHIPVTTNRFYASGDALNGSFQLGFDPSPNQTLMVVKQTGTLPVSGTFDGKPQGTLLAYDFQGTTIHFILRYDGGDGNDIVLVRTYPKENARYADARLGESFFHSFRIYNSEFSMTGVPAWLTPSRSSDYINFFGTPTAKGRHRITISVVGGSTTVIIVNVVEPLAQWKGRHFTPQEIADPNVSGNLADASGNGISNLMKFALGIPPKSNASGNLPKQALQRTWNDDYLTLTYRRDPSAEGIDYVVEVSDNLGSWQSGPGYLAEASRTPNPDGTETVVVWDVKPVKSSPTRFMRLKVIE